MPWRLLTHLGHVVRFATEHGDAAAADQRLLDGVMFGRLGAEAEPKLFYAEMSQNTNFQRPLAWNDVDTADFDGLLLPGGHAPRMRQYLGSELLRGKVADFCTLDRPLGAICHGVLVLARASDPSTGHSPLYGRRTTCLPKYM